jgi:hypothetical protein
MKVSRNGLVGNAREKGLLDKPDVPIVCGNSLGNMGDRNRTNWLTVGQSNCQVQAVAKCEGVPVVGQTEVHAKVSIWS